MRRLSILWLLAAAAQATADDSAPTPAVPPAPELRSTADGRFTDPYWSLTYDLPGIEETEHIRAPRIFGGEAGPMSIEILVTESDRPTTAAAVRDADAKSRSELRRELSATAAGDQPTPWSAFTERDATGRDIRHRYGYTVRGLQTFAVHVSAPAGTSTDDDLSRAVAGLRLGEDRGATLLSQAFAIHQRSTPDAIPVACAAADAYLRTRANNGLENLPMAAVALQRAVPRLSDPGTTPDQAYDLLERMGLTLLMQRHLAQAIAWLEKAAVVAARSSDPVGNAALSEYNIACAHALAGRADAAFAALDRAFAKYRPVDDSHLKSDADLVSLHGDPRWPAALARARPPAKKK